MNKYRNKKCTLDGITFDSKKEMQRYSELKLLERAGIIQNLELQVKYELIPSQKYEKKVVERAVTYVADFRYSKDGKTIVEDIKSDSGHTKTKDYIIKRKLMLYVHGIRIMEV